MEIITNIEFFELVDKKEIQIENVDRNSFKDDFRFKYHILEDLFHYTEKINLQSIGKPIPNKLSIFNSTIMPSNHYLGISREKISLPSNILGYIYTRSKFARLGLEFLNSSNIINPNFGFSNPEPIVFEISSKVEISGLDLETCYCYCLFFDTKKKKQNIPISQFLKPPFIHQF